MDAASKLLQLAKFAALASLELTTPAKNHQIRQFLIQLVQNHQLWPKQLLQLRAHRLLYSVALISTALLLKTQCVSNAVIDTLWITECARKCKMSAIFMRNKVEHASNVTVVIIWATECATSLTHSVPKPMLMATAQNVSKAMWKLMANVMLNPMSKFHQSLTQQWPRINFASNGQAINAQNANMELIWAREQEYAPFKIHSVNNLTKLMNNVSFVKEDTKRLVLINAQELTELIWYKWIYIFTTFPIFYNILNYINLCYIIL